MIERTLLGGRCVWWRGGPAWGAAYQYLNWHGRARVGLAGKHPKTLPGQGLKLSNNQYLDGSTGKVCEGSCQRGEGRP